MPISDPSVHLTDDEIDDLLYLARIGDVEDLEQTLADLIQGDSRRAIAIIEAAVDPMTGNTCLHYACANGHQATVTYLARPASEADVEENQEQLRWMIKANASGNTALHYAALNGHLEVIKALLAALDVHRTEAVDFATEGQGTQTIEQINEEFARLKSEFVSRKNNTGFDAAYEAETNGKEEVVNFLLGVMDEADAARAHGGESKDGEEISEVVGDEDEAAAGASDGQNGGAEDVTEKTKDLSIG